MRVFDIGGGLLRLLFLGVGQGVGGRNIGYVVDLEGENIYFSSEPDRMPQFDLDEPIG